MYEYIDGEYPSGLDEASDYFSKEISHVLDILDKTPYIVAIFKIKNKDDKFPHWIDLENGDLAYFPNKDKSNVASINKKGSWNSGAYYSKKDGSIFPYLEFIGYKDIKEAKKGVK